MGCIQSYFRKAATGSSQASPTDGDRQFIDLEKKNSEEEAVNSNVPIVSEEDLSPMNDEYEENDDENAEKGSLHCVEATAVRTLAASTGTVAILGTTAKYNEKVDYRKSIHDDSSTVDEFKSEDVIQIDDKLEPAQGIEKSQITQNGPTSIVTTAIIEVQPTKTDSEIKGEVDKEPIPETNGVEEVKLEILSNEHENKPMESQVEADDKEDSKVQKYLPKVVESIEKTKKDSFEKKDEPLKNETQLEPEIVISKEIKEEETQTKASPAFTEPETKAITSEVPLNGTTLEKVSQELQQVTEPENKISLQSSIELDDREHEKTNENSEIESTSSDIVSIVNDPFEKEVSHKKDSFIEELTRPNRLSVGQMSIEESEQNTVEISSADDVMKNESTDLTSPDSLKGSFDESLTKMNILVEGKAESKDDGETSSKEENAREISNTSLNTLGDDSEDDGSDLEGNFPRKSDHIGMKRFDTISSNGESSYNRVEDHNYPSVTEEPELEEMMDQKLMETEFINEDNVFDTEEVKRYKKSVRETVVKEVDDICKQAVEKTTDIMAKIAADQAIIIEPKDNDDVNNVSESSVLSAVDSVVAEKGSDFDSLSFLDEQSDSRSVSALASEDPKSKADIHEVATTSVSPADDAQKRLQEWEQIPSGVQEETTRSSEHVSGAVITQKDISIEGRKTAVDSVSEDLPKPPDLEEFPPLPENLDQFDVTEEELKSVQLPGESVQTANQGDSKNLPDHEIAASKIQAGVRGYLTRKQMKQQFDSQDKTQRANISYPESDHLQSLGKDYNVQKKRMSLDSKLGDIENIHKLQKLRSTLSECVEEESENPDLDKAAVKIQKTFRNYRARKSICLGDSKKILNGQSTIASKILELNENSEKAADEKSSVEKVNGNITAEPSQPKAIEEDQESSAEKQISVEQMGSNRMAIKTFDEDPIKQAAVKIQATYRGFKTRKSIQISASAATKIQAHFRGYKVRKSIKHSSSLNDLRNSAGSSCSEISTQQDLEKSATKIQAGIRGYLVRKRHSLQNNAAAKIQINYRKYKSRKETKPQRSTDQ